MIVISIEGGVIQGAFATPRDTPRVLILDYDVEDYDDEPESIGGYSACLQEWDTGSLKPEIIADIEAALDRRERETTLGLDLFDPPQESP
jgi:hypothetical protein